MFCREQVARLISRKEEFEAVGDLVIVGNGTAQFASAFKEDFAVTLPLYTNPDQSLYKALSLANNKGALLKLKSMKNTARALKAGFRQGASKGDVWQQGGVAVFNASKELVFVHRDDTPGDLVDIDEVLSAAGSCGS